MIFGAIEAGGTNFNCAVGSGPDNILARTRIATTTPKETLAAVYAFFQSAIATHGKIEALGLACFGPVDLDRQSPGYGHILRTPKKYWSNTDIVGKLKKRLQVPVGFETDVNGAALAELEWGAGQGLRSLVYMTIGTGIGGGVIVNGRMVDGLIHPELGHMLVPRHARDTQYQGHCPYHGDCLEGLACGPAIHARWGAPAEKLEPDHIAWEVEADYLGSMCMNITATLSPQRIILGGGVMRQPFLIQKVRDVFQHKFNDYLPLDVRAGGLEKYIVTPGLGGRAGIAGAFKLASQSISGYSH